MNKIQLKIWNAAKPCQKNVLYKIVGSQTILFEEPHETQKESVNLEYCLADQQYGIYAHEYRGPHTVKEQCKTPDILACAVDDTEKRIISTICDVKSNISAFSDNLLKDNAMLTAIKEVRDFIEQIHDGLLHKNSFMLYYTDDGYRETERLGIVTKNFEPQKFRDVAEMLEHLVEGSHTAVSPLVANKLRRNLSPYMSEAEKIRAFAERTLIISGKKYELHVFLLKEVDELNYAVTLKIDVPCNAHNAIR